jgi:cytochrome c peroxidase
MWFTLAAVVLIAKVDLGRHIFYDARMSINGTQSCASCHHQNLAFTDGKPQAIGSTGQQHPRSAMSLVNLTRAKLLTWTNPHEQTLEEQALTPMFGDHPVELGVNADAYVALIRNDATYRVLFTAAALPCSISAVTQAIAAFERTIISNRSPYDRYHSGTDDHAISDSAKRGETLFFSEPLSCFRCHGGPNFSDSAELKDNGLLPEGGRFKAPTLRNIAVTAPYMHDGRLLTLDAVLEHYSSGGKHSPTQDELIRGFTLTQQDRADLLAFLQSLTDQQLLRDPRYSNPWPASTLRPTTR